MRGKHSGILCFRVVTSSWRCLDSMALPGFVRFVQRGAFPLEAYEDHREIVLRCVWKTVAGAASPGYGNQTGGTVEPGMGWWNFGRQLD